MGKEACDQRNRIAGGRVTSAWSFMLLSTGTGSVGMSRRSFGEASSNTRRGKAPGEQKHVITDRLVR